MKSLKKLFIVVFILSCYAASAQVSIFTTHPEVYFKFQVHPKQELSSLSKIISIDKVKDGWAYAYANAEEFRDFEKSNMPYELLSTPSLLIKPEMVDEKNLQSSKDWNVYPSYTAYEVMMSQFQADYPTLCDIDTITTLSSGRRILVAKIKADVQSSGSNPQLLYSSSIHGDEVVGYVLMLRLIDYLLSNYASDARINYLLNHCEIYINPLANPDGTYHSGNASVSGATRYNANSVDLNRNYPDPQDGNHPDGNAWQPETQAFMSFALNHHFVMAANFHGGAEVVNYPWDTWSRLHADDAWWQYVAREYADTVHANSPSGYFDDLDDGITNGYAWYQITGGRQDYMNYFHHCREVTIEISSTKMPSGSQLPNYWNYNYRSLLNYMEQSMYGFQGFVTDSLTGEPLKTRIFANAHDIDSSDIYSSPALGDYHRPAYTGTYSFTFSAPGYKNKTLSGVGITNRTASLHSVQLAPLSPTVSENNTIDINEFCISNSNHITIVIESLFPQTLDLMITNLYGAVLFNEKLNIDKGHSTYNCSLSNVPPGMYVFWIKTNKSTISKKTVLF